MLYYIKLKNKSDDQPFYNSNGWKSNEDEATLFDSKQEALATAFDEDLDENEFSINLRRMTDIVNELRIDMEQMEFVELLGRYDRNEMEQRYKVELARRLEQEKKFRERELEFEQSLTEKGLK